MGITFFLIAALLTIYCGLLLGRCANVDVPYGYPPIQHNHEVGARAMGRTGVILATVGNHTTSVMVATLFIITGADEMATIFGDALNRYEYAIIFYLIILPPVYFKNMSHIAALGYLGSAASFLVFIVAIVSEFLFLASDEYSSGTEEYAKPAFASSDPLVYVAVLSGSYFSFG